MNNIADLIIMIGSIAVAVLSIITAYSILKR